MNGVPLVLRESGFATITDPTGRYLFRDLAAGPYTVSVHSKAEALTRAVQLAGQPVNLTNVDFKIGRPGGPDAHAAGVLPVKPKSPAATAATVLSAQPPPLPGPSPAPKALESVPAAAQQHNALGRVLTKAGRYREAIAELNEALRIAPDFAQALNARGFALLKLHDSPHAIEDLNKAILLKPNYADAYHIRGVAWRTIGDTARAAADLKRAEELAH